jgi:hypothetical protein
MPKNKDLKRLVRARMAKTGESFTTARMHVIAKVRPAPREKAKKPPARATRVVVGTAADYEKLAGMKDATVKARNRLHVGALGQGARLLGREDHDAHRDRRARLQEVEGQRLVGADDHGRLRTHPRPARAQPARRRLRGVEEPHVRVHGRRPVGGVRAGGPQAVARRRNRRNAQIGSGKVARWKRSDGSKVEVLFSSKGPGKAVAALQHDALSNKADVERWRTFWTERFGLLAEWLAAHAQRRSPTAV